MEGIYKFYWDKGRNGFLEGIFTASEEAVQVFNDYSLECGYNPFDYLSE